MKVSIIIPNYNGRELLEKNLGSVIDAFKNKNNKICEVIIVDNGSKDSSIEYINSNFKPYVKLIKHTKNRGFSTAVNTGARASKGEILCLLNNDVIPEVNFLEKALDLFEDKDVFSVSLHEKGRGPSGALFNNGIIDLSHSKPEAKNPVLSFYTSGAAGLFRKSIWKELSGLDDRLLSPFYWEDIDICYRASKRGYLNIWCPYGKVIHNHESTSSKLPKKYVARIKERNQLLMLWKNIQSKSFLQKHFNELLKRLYSHPGYLLVVFMALMRITTVFKLRNKEIKESVVSDEAVFQRYS